MNFRRNKLRFLDLLLRPDDEYVFESVTFHCHPIKSQIQKKVSTFFFMIGVKVLTETRYV